MTRTRVVDESTKEITVAVKLPQLHYIDEFIRLKCAPDILSLFPNVKEISESMTAFSAVRRYMGAEAFGEDMTLLDVGCGHTPRTAALFAHMTRWDCVAIDPVLHNKKTKIERLRMIPKEIECVDITRHEGCVVVLAIHAHIDLNAILESVTAMHTIIVAMPCCKPLELSGHKPIEEYEDLGCLSPKRSVKIYDISDVELLNDFLMARMSAQTEGP